MCYFTNIDLFGGPRELPEAFEDISSESAVNGIGNQRNQYLDVYRSQSFREKLEEEDDEDVGEDEHKGSGGDYDDHGDGGGGGGGGGDGEEVVHQKPFFRSRANKKRKQRLSIQDFDGKLVHQNNFRGRGKKKRTRRLSIQRKFRE